MGLLDDLDRRREREMRDRENGARLAQAYATFYTEGLGTVVHGDRIEFGLTFIERPVMSYGSACDVEAIIDQLFPASDATDDDNALPLPLTSGYVVDWDQDERDFYVGCWVAARVYYPAEDLALSAVSPEEIRIEVEHHFTFAGIAMKDIPVDREDAISG